MKKDDRILVVSEYISQAAILDQCAEECTELAKACLKLARYLRNENPVSPSLTVDSLLAELNGEIGDVLNSIEVIKADEDLFISEEYVNNIREYKKNRLIERIKNKILNDKEKN